ncbi:U3 small nucleolar RNA-interacting protein 2-like isoform X2 [Gigantopelta aegis]|uniref:U3 small nucleolar RNA-interacting protein 2-like isoform X2 n=1 Tax=Gigantopelta aegis TaxID=1735272 RepID=UPI001B88900E|nr:U3 small nucleolar RNA-interacting protein 2-like isoform X2 [Gigantopelta aegis]
MSFFIRRKKDENKHVKAKKGRNHSEAVGRKKDGPPRKKKKIVDEEIESDSDIENDEGAEKQAFSSEEEEEETAQEKKLRLTKQYLAKMEAHEAELQEDEAGLKDAISHRLKEELLEQTGRLYKEVADKYLPPDPGEIKVLRGHQLSVTCVVISPDSQCIFSAAKDCSIIKWNVEQGKKMHVIHGGRKGTEKRHTGHTGHVLSLAISSDGKYLASGDANKLIHIWNPDNCELIHTFEGHRGPVTGLSFRKGSHQLFSASHDRFVKVWNLDEMAYVETLIGHQDAITGIDSLTRERALTCGGRDNSIRIWKIIEESQLLFLGHGSSIDCVSLINESNFVSGADDNSISLWGVMKKKPLFTVKNAHGSQNPNSAQNPDTTQNKQTSVYQENWITSISSMQYTDLIASGSKDGCVRFWKCGEDFKSLKQIFSVPLKGFVNCVKFSGDGQFVVAGIGQEHRLGRWWRLKEAKNSVCVIPLHKKEKEKT